MTLLHRCLYQLVQIRFIACRDGDEVGDENGESHVLLIAAEGSAEIRIGDNALLLNAGDIYCAAPRQVLSIRNVPEHTPVRAYRLDFERFGLMEQSSAHRLFRKPGFHLNSGKLHTDEPHRVLALAEELAVRSFEDPRRTESRFRQLLEALFEPGLPAEERPPSKVRQAVDYMREHYSDKITRDSMADMLRLNPEYFSVLFKKETGAGFSEFLNRLRIEKAKELLFLGRRGVHDTAIEVGYADGFYFSRKFKELTGETPTAFIGREKRIVALQHVGHLLALGVHPVGAAPTYLSKWGVADEWLADVAEIGELHPAEDIAALQPDLVIAHHLIGEEHLERLSSAARTVVVPYNKRGPFELFAYFAELLGKQEEAAAFLARYERKAEQARQRLAGVIREEETVAYYEIWQDRIWLMSEANGRGVANLYRGLRLRPPEALQREVLGPGVPLSIKLEELPRYAADRMLVGVYRSDKENANDSGWLGRLLQSREWQDIPAVSEGRVSFVDLTVFAPSDMLSLYYQLDVQADYLLGESNKSTQQKPIF
ncbi:substrate-binding family protein [Cohnella sp. SGD-V74]|nr:substrate-binding family protein [Cohnella sp. SGD-V74]